MAAYLVAWGELVVLIAVLSPMHLVLRGVVVPSSALILGGSIVVWKLAGLPRPPTSWQTLRKLVDVLHDPALAILAVAVAGGFGYLAALALWTPANSWDAMWYHLARAAFWKQQHAVAYIPDVNDSRLNGNPPVAEIGALYTMVVGSTDRFVTTVALSAYVAATAGVFGIARRLFLDARAALFGALVFATLPVVVAQASGALNDLVVAAFLASCVYFLLGEGSAELGLAGLALALALATKLTALLSLPIVILVAFLMPRKWRLRTLALTGSLAVVVGCGWYGLNLAETGTALGGSTAHVAHSGSLMVASTARMLLDFAEVPAAGAWTVSFVLAAIAAAGLTLWERGHARESARQAGVAALVALTPVAILFGGPVAKKGYQWIFFHIGRPDLGIIDQDRGFVGVSALASFYGPLGLLLLVSAAGIPFLPSRRWLPRVAVLCAATPAGFALLLVITIGYNHDGRYFMFPVALAAASAAAFFRLRPLAWGVVAVAATTMLLTLIANDEKPPKVWGEPRWQVQTQVAGRTNGEKDVIRFVDNAIPPRARIGLAIRPPDWSYPFFGSHLERTVRFIPPSGPAGRDLQWLIVAPTQTTRIGAWTTVFRTSDGWRVLRRRGA